MTTRFVILHHRRAQGEHWDFMLEAGDVLMTWQLSREPTGPEALPIPARRIADHRKAYLDYEGPVSGNRGTVTRVESGTFELLSQIPDRIEFRLAGEKFVGRFAIGSDGDSCKLESCMGSVP
ncbi:MAG: hypothetical protein J5J06_06320 [Phycisphaerae bacterium]|nr:hypothetical protein [Phycisphaerae bacterium]